MTKQYKRQALAAVHEMAADFTKSGGMAKSTMRAYNETCLTPVEGMSLEAIRELRLREYASQAVFDLCPQHNDELGEPVGAWREASSGWVAEAVDADSQERAGSGCVRSEFPRRSNIE